ncbi:MAG: DUF975 family protein [Lachnospiraceae bacterium]|nr:DUF975 family protein [Lachnospiraceae bacterium]
MWNRKDMKAKGKLAFKANYWRCVLVAFIGIVIAGALGGYGGGRASSVSTSEEGMTALMNGDIAQYYGLILGVIGSIMLIAVIVSILIYYPLVVGVNRFFIVNRTQPAEVGEVGYGFKNFGRSVLGLLLSELLIFLGCLVVIPGIILSYSYRLVPYIIADDPTISATDAIKKSREMMKGYKWKSFVLDLSFIGWIFLTAITFGLVGIFYAYPYMYATYAEMYKVVSGSDQPAPVSDNQFINTINNASDAVGDAVENTVEKVVDKVGDVAEAAGDAVADVVDNIKKD